MSEHYIDYKLHAVGDRNIVRMAVIKKFSKEEPGIGKDKLVYRHIHS